MLLKEEYLEESNKEQCSYISSNIRTTIYNKDTKNLVIEFKANSLYVYFDVPYDVYLSLKIAESQGQFFRKNIMNKYKYLKIENDMIFNF